MSENPTLTLTPILFWCRNSRLNPTLTLTLRPETLVSGPSVEYIDSRPTHALICLSIVHSILQIQISFFCFSELELLLGAGKEELVSRDVLFYSSHPFLPSHLQSQFSILISHPHKPQLERMERLRNNCEGTKKNKEKTFVTTRHEMKSQWKFFFSLIIL